MKTTKSAKPGARVSAHADRHGATPQVRARRPPARAGETLGHALIAARREGRLDRAALASALHVHPRTVRRWETGQASPPPRQAARLVEALLAQAPAEATRLAALAGVALPPPPPPPVDARAIEEAIGRAADALDVAPRRVREAVRGVVAAALDARAGLADLVRLLGEAERAPGPSPS